MTPRDQLIPICWEHKRFAKLDAPTLIYFCPICRRGITVEATYRLILYNARG